MFLSERELGEPTVKAVSEPSKPQTISEQEFFYALGTVDPTYPAAVSDLLDSARSVGCQPELKRTYVIYADDPFGGSLNLDMISMDGTVSIWGAASRDPQLGEPVGRAYLDSIARVLPGADVKDTFSKSGSWYARFNGRTAIPLRELLARKSDWISAMAAVVQKLQRPSPRI